MIQYTPEQGDVLDHIVSTDGILLVRAGAGTGKTFIAKQTVATLEPKRALYTAFNKAIVTEGIDRFEDYNVECKTMHALAYKYVKPKGNISDITYTCIEENVAYKVKFEVIEAINMFFVSSSTDMYEFFDDYFKDYPNSKLMVGLCEKYTEMMVNGELPPSFNFMLKYFHLMLVSGEAECKYDLVILDEINDTTAVVLEIFKLIQAPKKLGLGETHQAIYKFLNLVNGFEELADEPALQLTQSWRCSEEIASRIQKFMRKEVTDDFAFVGTNDPVANGKTLYCTNTNAFIVDEINNRISSGQGFRLLRSIADIFAAPLAVTSAAQGKVPYQKKFLYLHDEYKNFKNDTKYKKGFFNYLLDHVDDKETQNAVQLLISFGRKGINLFDLYKKAKSAPSDPNYTVATVYTSKGLEFETVVIADDLNGAIETIRNNGGIKDDDDLVQFRCYYVACSRAGVNLINAKALPC